MEKAPFITKKDIAIGSCVAAVLLYGMLSTYEDNATNASPDTSAPPAAPAAPANWHARSNDGGCFAYSPAKYLSRYEGDVNKPSVNETRDKNGTLISVKLTSWGGLSGSSVTFWRTEADCLAAIEESERIPDDYR